MAETTDEQIREVLRRQKLKEENRELLRAKKKIQNAPEIIEPTTALAKIKNNTLKSSQDEWYPQYLADCERAKREDEWFERDKRQFEQKKAQIQEICQIKEDHLRRLAQIKREYEPKKELTFVPIADQAVLNTPCPRGKGPGYCITHYCDDRSRCYAEDRINRVDLRRSMQAVADLS